jgi:hypothetical protein
VTLLLGSESGGYHTDDGHNGTARSWPQIARAFSHQPATTAFPGPSSSGYFRPPTGFTEGPVEFWRLPPDYLQLLAT